jgi:Geranylgeranyl pyrophosphate synthase
MILNAIKSSLEPLWGEYTRIFEEAIRSPYALLTETNAHVLTHRGKELRPVLTLLSAKMCGTPNLRSCVMAAVTEMFHTATLLHDDVADQSDLRRGAATVRKLISPTASVLLGDFWFSRAFQLLMDHKGELMLNDYAHAIRGMSEGELFQIEKASQRDTSIEDYFEIITAKTALLIMAGMRSGAASVQASPQMLSHIEQIGKEIGIVFQIRDDILDYSPQYNTGKPSYHDLQEGKMTLPLLGALENASSQARRQAGALIKAQPLNSPVLQGVLDFVAEYGGVEYAQTILEKRIQDVVAKLEQLSPTQARNQTIDIVHYLSRRKI